ncbi:phage portal protein [Halomonas eurihalina]|uniref:Phage portal protein n=1 Tax=Halomonas eurihalina TaxID=42566 RepID=A0A5D9DBI4_HALER|nr:phage portal protein [Halomonas eurihalina]MDR5858208.1 phage portal protein [Halomonas eurihalina]TZG41294.1 phage portal protein [Halomonas eurihalina]
MFLDALFSPGAEGRSLENPDEPITGQSLDEYLGEAGISVNNQNAMTLSAVYACIYVLSSSIAQLPLHVMRKQGDSIEAAKDHPAYWMLHDEPNAWQTSYKWRETKQGHVLGWGNGFTQVVRSNRGELRELVMRRPWETQLVKNGNRWLYAVVEEDEGARAVQLEDMIHVRALGSDGRTGKSLIRQHAETIGLGLAAQQYGKDFFGGGGRPTGLVTVKNTLQKDSWERLKDTWQKSVSRLKGSENKTLMLPADLDYKSITIPPEDAQFLETRKFNRSEVAGIFNVPAHMINDLDKATFSNISEQAIQFVRHTMMPWIVNWEQEINRRIFTRAERAAGYYCKFNLAGLLRGTAKERAEFYHYAITDGWMDRNEARVLEDMNPRDGLDEMLISVNAQPASQLGQPNNPEEPTS